MTWWLSTWFPLRGAERSSKLFLCIDCWLEVQLSHSRCVELTEKEKKPSVCQSAMKPDSSPVVVDPTALHTHTLIMLHGRGSNAQRFAHDMSHIFPQAPLRRCTARKRMKMNVWFDSASFEDPSIHEHLHIEGIHENARVLGEIIQAEAELVGLNRVFLALLV